jgi:uncharacterized protein YdeI (YjbR/CyaY-like superfamily)
MSVGIEFPHGEDVFHPHEDGSWTITSVGREKQVPEELRGPFASREAASKAVDNYRRTKDSVGSGATPG